MGRGDHPGELEALVLGAVVRVGDGANGVAVYEEIGRTVDRDPSVSGVHVTLRWLEAKGLLESTVGTPSPRGGRPRRYYRPTPRGLDALSAFREVWVRLLGDLPLPEPGGSS
jgi:DNA-binding PadR family transcriptional regulator